MGPRKHTKKMMCAHQSRKSESYTARRPFGSTNKNLKLWHNQLYIIDIGESSSRKLRWVIY